MAIKKGKAPAKRTQETTTVKSAKVSNLDPDTAMGIDPATKAVPNAELADAQDDAMADPAEPGINGEDSDSNMDEAADLEMLDAMNEAGDFDSEEDVDVDAEDAEADDIEEDEEEDDSEEEGVPLPPDAALPLIGAPPKKSTSTSTSNQPPSTSTAPEQTPESILHPQRPTPYTLDPGNLLITDPNPLSLPSTNPEATLQASARDATQVLLNTLLTTCQIRTLPPSLASGSSTAGVTITLPPPVTQLPREKPLPTPKAETTWEKFARKKGVGKYNQHRIKGQEAEGRAGKMVYDETKGEWVPRWGYKGRNKDGENDWLVEIDDKKAAAGQDDGRDPRGVKRAERKERVRREERKMRANAKKGVKGKA